MTLGWSGCTLASVAAAVAAAATAAAAAATSAAGNDCYGGRIRL